MVIQSLHVLTSELLKKKNWFQPLQLLPDLLPHLHLHILKHLKPGKGNMKIPGKWTNFYFIFAFHFDILYLKYTGAIH